MRVELPVAIVTGASSGIGQAAAVALAADGFHVVMLGTHSERITKTLQLIERAGAGPAEQHLGLCADVTSERAVRAVAETACERFGRIDLLVASAGIGSRPGSRRKVPYPTSELPLDEWSAVLNVNLTGVFLCNRAVLPAMLGQRRGQIINVCSSTTPHGLRGRAYAPAYCASKFGVTGLTEALAEEVRTAGIRVQALFPGAVDTPLVAETALTQAFGGSLPPAQVADMILYLVHQPIDAVLVHPHLLPLRRRRTVRSIRRRVR